MLRESVKPPTPQSVLDDEFIGSEEVENLGPNTSEEEWAKVQAEEEQEERDFEASLLAEQEKLEAEWPEAKEHGFFAQEDVHNEVDPEPFETPYNDDEPYTYEDIPKLEMQVSNLMKMDAEVRKAHQTLLNIKERIVDYKLEVAADHPDLGARVSEEFAHKHEQLIEHLYAKFQQNQSAKELSRDQRIAFMREVLALTVGDNYTQHALPSFYAVDLIAFGLERRIPEAIRLGEKLIHEQGGQVPQHMAVAVRQFMLDASNQELYRKSGQVTGAISNAKIYQGQQDQGLLSVDDPYWREFLAKNSRREDIWRTPSIYSWNYKKTGILGEVVNMELIRQKYERATGSGKMF